MSDKGTVAGMAMRLSVVVGKVYSAARRMATMMGKVVRCNMHWEVLKRLGYSWVRGASRKWEMGISASESSICRQEILIGTNSQADWMKDCFCMRFEVTNVPRKKTVVDRKRWHREFDKDRKVVVEVVVVGVMVVGNCSAPRLDKEKADHAVVSVNFEW
jgi:hypothetical protein